MKTMKNFLSMAALALMGAMMTGCSNDDNFDNPQQPETKNNVVTLTTTVGLGGSNGTRALDASGHKTFAVGDKIAVLYYSSGGKWAVSEALTAEDITNGGKSAQFTVTLEDPDKNFDVTYVYPASMVKMEGGGQPNYEALATQDGTLNYVSNHDLCDFTGAWVGDNLPEGTLTNRLAILAITLKNEAGTSDITSGTTKLTVSDGTNTYNVNREAAAGPIYVAIRPTSDATIDITATSGGKGYYKTLTTPKSYAANNGYPVSWKMTQGVRLAGLTGNYYTAQDGDVLTGTLGSNVKISIANGATVTLKDVNINGSDTWTYGEYAGITCAGDATIILEGTNTVKGFAGDYPGILVPEDKTLIIQGSGSLEATGRGDGAGIGGGYLGNCGNITISGGDVTAVSGVDGNAAGIGTGYCGNCGDITISGGTVTATGGKWAAGIGCGGGDSTCGDILISGGTVTATGGSDAAGIGGGYADTMSTNSCGEINITSGVTHVTATKGESNEANSTGPESIGAGGYYNGVYDEEMEADPGESICDDVNIEDGANVTQN